MIARVSHWVDERLGLAKVSRRTMDHVFPDHWSFMLGEIAFYSFLILIGTGVFLAMFFNASEARETYGGPYHPLDGISVSAAYQSVLHLSFSVRAGLLMRQMHHWAADIFVAAIVLHLARIFFTAAYRKPREMNWIVGVTLLLAVIFNGYFGYSLGGDLLSGLGLRIGYSIALSIPFIGPWLAFIFFGGVYPSYATTPRLYILHVFIVPAVIVVLLALHLGMIWRQHHTNYPGRERGHRSIVGSRFWPSYTAKSLGLFSLLAAFVAFLGGFVQINPVWIYGPYNPSAALPGAQPDWYLGWIEGALRLFPGVNLRFPEPVGWLIPEVFFPAVLFPVLLFLILYAYPFLEKLVIPESRRPHDVLLMPYDQPFKTAAGCAVFAFLVVIFFAGSDDVIATATGNSVTAIRMWLRVLVFVFPAFTWAVVYGICTTMKRHATARRAFG